MSGWSGVICDKLVVASDTCRRASVAVVNTTNLEGAETWSVLLDPWHLVKTGEL